MSLKYSLLEHLKTKQCCIACCNLTKQIFNVKFFHVINGDNAETSMLVSLDIDRQPILQPFSLKAYLKERLDEEDVINGGFKEGKGATVPGPVFLVTQNWRGGGGGGGH